MPVTSPVITTLTTLNQTLDVVPPIRTSAGGSWEVRVDNITQFALLVTVGGTNYWLMPLSAGIYKESGPVELILFAAAQVGNVTVPQIFLTWAEHPDTIPPSIPASAGITTSTVSPVATTFHGAKVWNNVVQAIPDSAWFKPQFDQTDFDTDAYFNIANPTRLTVPANLDGYYHVVAGVGFAASGAGTRQSNIYKNGVSIDREFFALDPNAGVTATYWVLDAILKLVAGDIIESAVWQSSGGPLNIARFDTTLAMNLIGT